MLSKFKEFFKSDKEKTKERFLNLFQINASDIDEILWDIRDEMEVINIRYEISSPSLTVDLITGKDSKFRMVRNPLDDSKNSLDSIFLDAYENRQTQGYLFSFYISFLMKCYDEDLEKNKFEINEVMERINDIVEFDSVGMGIGSSSSDQQPRNHKISINFYLFK